MIDFDYIRPRSIVECVELLRRYEKKAKLLAGGTDLMVEFRANDKKVKDVEIIIDTAHISELKFIREEDDLIEIGAGVTFSELAESDLLRRYAPILCEAALAVGSPQIRNAGTLGGSLGTASPASDPAPPLVALDAVARIAGPCGERELPVSLLVGKSSDEPMRHDEMIVSVSFKKTSGRGGFSFLKLGRRKTLAIARMNVAVYVETDENNMAVDVRIVPGASFPSAVRVKAAERMLLGKVPDVELHSEIGKKLAEEMVKVTGRRWSTPYKEPVIAVLVSRALNEAAGVKSNG